MAITTNLGITLVEQSQSQKEVTVNEALVKLDAIMNRGAVDKDLATPPGSPADGDIYIVAASATGDWASHEGEVAYYQQVWQFIIPNEGMTLWVNDENKLYTYNGSAWGISSSGGGASVLDDLSDVTITSPSSGEVLKYDGSVWVNDTISGGSSTLSGLSDTTVSSPASNDFLVYNGSAWVNKTPSQSRTSMGVVIGTDVQAFDSDLSALAALSTTGMVSRTGAGTAAVRTITAPAAGITVSNGDGVSGNPTLALANDLSAVEGLSSTGLTARTATDTWTARTITGTSNVITVTNGDGVSGNPTLTTGSLVVRTDTVQAFTKQQYFGEATLTDGASISWDLDNAQTAKVTLAGNRTLSNPTNMHAGATYILRVIQDATGSRTLSYGTAYKWPGGTAPTLTTAASAVDVITFYCNGTQMLGVVQKDFK